MSSADALSDRSPAASTVHNGAVDQETVDGEIAGVEVRREFDGASDSPSLDRDQRIRAEMIGELVRESGRLRVIPFMVVGILAAVFMERAPIWPAIVLTIGVLVMIFAADRLRRAYEAEPSKTGNAEAWGLRYAALSALVGLVWGASVASYFDAGSYPHQAFLALLIFGSLVAAVVHRALYPPAFLAFAVPTSLPIVVMFVLDGGDLALATAGAGVIGMIMLFGWQRGLNRRYRESMALRFENTDLIERLETAHRSAETARLQAEAGDRAKSEFLATISHELRTPMNGIIGMTGLLQGTRLTQQQRSYAEIVRESADALLNLINDILDLTKLEAGRVELDDAPFEVARTVESVVGLMAARAQAKGLEIVSHINGDCPEIMTADAGRLRQILLNLVSNAIKFTDTGHVTLAVALAPGQSDVLRFEVSDTGIGIPADVQPRLFRPFSQGGGISRRFGGTGLGLAISRRLVNAMGGDIRLSSIDGSGSVFTVDLPVRNGRSVRRLGDLASLSVMIAGPDGKARDVAARYARDWRVKVTEAATPAEAISLMQAGDTMSACVIDWRVRGGAGSLARQIRANPGTADCRLILTVPVGVVEALAEDEDALFDGRILQPLRRSVYHRALSGVPMETHDAAASDQAPARDPSGHRLRVLIVDDVAVNQKLASSIVESAGHDAFSAGGGREALQALRSLPYDMVLMDVEMPDMDGLAATRAVRLLPGAVGRIPIIAMTAHPGDEYLERCVDAGMNGYLAKPLDAEELLQLLRQRAAEGGAKADHAAHDDSCPTMARLTRRLDPETSRSLLLHFVKDLEGWETSLGDADAQALRQLAHAIRGAALNLGLDALAAAAEELERISGQADADGATALDGLLENMRRTRHDLTTELSLNYPS
ncbi:MAG: ATP-binding protein [Minwuia sp.]|nr:ATP-binding protein [Minwuia sp.]